MDCFEFMEWNDKICNLEDREPTSRNLGAYRNQLYRGDGKLGDRYKDKTEEALKTGAKESIYQQWRRGWNG